MENKKTNTQVTNSETLEGKKNDRSLYSFPIEDKYKYLREKVYENIKYTRNGQLSISTFYCRKVAELLGGDYDDLSKVQQIIFKSDIVFEHINVERGFSKYTTNL